ncbi:hypothetical protein MSP7336_01815 [Mycobacterium shimoidei]|uniref:Uncharacterized protein n=1 Tax=Mycobacterium shimoidei TaxID=29313 RepID=A0A375YXI5_MYCSH|nr:hypothetical protein [Mycobacterium shimoidei]SRX93576.1 hypothetical protein MSP7336_01815 [Mycobacterium shimoidei]
MAAIPSTVDIDCPRCHTNIQCALEVKALPPKPGTNKAQLQVRVADLAERFAEHYKQAGHDA